VQRIVPATDPLCSIGKRAYGGFKSRKVKLRTISGCHLSKEAIPLFPSTGYSKIVPVSAAQIYLTGLSFSMITDTTVKESLLICLPPPLQTIVVQPTAL